MLTYYEPNDCFRGIFCMENGKETIQKFSWLTEEDYKFFGYEEEEEL